MMKPEKKLNKAFLTFQGDEDEALLRLAYLKERADYRTYFAENIGKVNAAYSRRKEERAKGPGHPPNEEAENTIRRFHEEMLQRFGILPSSYAGRPFEEWSSFFDPHTDAKAAPEAVRRYILPWLFYWPGVREIVTLTPPVTVLVGKGECPRITDSTECAPYERLYKVDLRKKPSVLLQEFKAALVSVDARRGINPEAYTEWNQDKTRKREEKWDQLEVWKRRRGWPKKSFTVIAREMRISLDLAKKRFYSAFELIEGRPYDPVLYRQAYRQAIKKDELKKTCAGCSSSVRDACGASGNLCPEVIAYVDQDQVKSLGKTISFKKADHVGSRDPRPGRSTPTRSAEPDDE